jgi:hypothetical protein
VVEEKRRTAFAGRGTAAIRAGRMRKVDENDLYCPKILNVTPAVTGRMPLLRNTLQYGWVQNS